MSIPQSPSPLTNVLAAKTYNAAWFSGATKEAQITAAIAAAVTDGALHVMVPANMLPYNASAVTFDNSIHMLAEGFLDASTANAKAYGAAGDDITDDTAALQAMINYASTNNALTTPRAKAHLPAGLYKITSTLVIPLTRLVLVGDGQYQSIIDFSTVAGSCIAMNPALVYAQLNFADFGILGTSSSGKGIDISAQSDYAFGTFERLYIIAGQQAIYTPRIFSAKFDSVFATSFNSHAFLAHCGPGTSWINCYAVSCGPGKAGYRLSGTIAMYSCNGVNSGDYWGVFGNKPDGTDGFQNDFPASLGIAYPDIELHACNLEAWSVTGVYITQAYQAFKMYGGTFVRGLAGNYHSAIHTVLQALPAGGFIELDSVRALITGGVPTGAAGVNIYGETVTPTKLKNDGTGFTTYFSVSAGNLTYPCVKETIVSNTFNEIALSISSLTSRRLSADILRFNDSTLADGATSFDSTGKTLVRTANTAPTNLGFAAYTITPGLGGDSQRNGFLIIQVEDSNTTIVHNVGTSGQFQLLGGKNYVATKGDVLVFVVSEYDTGVLHRGWVQISGTRSQSLRDSFVQAYSASITIDNSKGEEAIITANNATPFTINAPTNSVQDRKLLITIRNTNIGALGAITMNAIFHSAGAIVAPAAGFQRTYAFKWNGASYQELYRTSADVAN